MLSVLLYLRESHIQIELSMPVTESWGDLPIGSSQHKETAVTIAANASETTSKQSLEAFLMQAYYLGRLAIALPHFRPILSIARAHVLSQPAVERSARSLFGIRPQVSNLE